MHPSCSLFLQISVYCAITPDKMSRQATKRNDPSNWVRMYALLQVR